jgi:hypothetical protein
VAGYSQVSLGTLTSQISGILDDAGQVYWTAPEIQYAIWEALRYWGALTNYWRARGAFALSPGTPYYDLSVQLPALRTRSWTLGQMTQEIQYLLLEAPNGISGVGMSGQVSVSTILSAIQRARNRFALDSKIPLSIHRTQASTPPDGLVTL